VRILHLVDSLNAGGAERMALNISNLMAEDIGHFSLLCSSRKGGILEDYVSKKENYVCLDKRNAFDIIAFSRLLKLLYKLKIEVIHAHSSSVFWAVASKIFRPSLKIIWHDHSGDTGNLNANRKKTVQIISSSINGVIAVNNDLKLWAVGHLKVKQENIVYLNNFPHLAEAKRSDVTSNNVKIVYLANIRWQKDHLTLVNAVEILIKEFRCKNFHVMLAGTYQNDDYYNCVINAILEANLENYFTFLGSVEDVSELLANCDIGVISSVSEGLPVSLLEYGLAGLPSLATDVGYCAEVLGHGEYGKIVPVSDSYSLAKELDWLIVNRIEAVRLGAMFKNHVEQEYGAQKFLSDYVPFVNKLVKSNISILRGQ
jgi:glycosyltransferase involved in cell wall biosynthesis